MLPLSRTQQHISPCLSFFSFYYSDFCIHWVISLDWNERTNEPTTGNKRSIQNYYWNKREKSHQIVPGHVTKVTNDTTCTHTLFHMLNSSLSFYLFILLLPAMAAAAAAAYGNLPKRVFRFPVLLSSPHRTERWCSSPSFFFFLLLSMHFLDFYVFIFYFYQYLIFEI